MSRLYTHIPLFCDFIKTKLLQIKYSKVLFIYKTLYLQKNTQLYTIRRMKSDLRYFFVDIKGDLPEVPKLLPSRLIVNKQVVHDHKIRLSDDIFIAQPRFEQIAISLTTNCFQGQAKVISLDDQWCAAKYEDGGHFVWHCDALRERPGYTQVGTQILLPPLEKCNYDDGELQIKSEKEIVSIRPHKTLWTFIMMPLGMQHRVKPVKGTRWSFIKQVYAVEVTNLQLDMPNENDVLVAGYGPDHK